jgi:hypothetical protein
VFQSIVPLVGDAGLLANCGTTIPFGAIISNLPDVSDSTVNPVLIVFPVINLLIIT